MRGIRISMVIALPFILGALYTGTQLIYFEKDEFLYYFLGLIAIVLAIYFAGAEINYWYNKKYPPKLDPPIIMWLERYFPFYTQLEGEEKQKFENRLALYLSVRSFTLMIKERKEIPEDFKAIIAAHGIKMTMGLEDYLVGDYDRIICYNHPFPTPKNKFLHTAEVDHEDGVLLLSIEQLMMGVGQPQQFYNLAYHVYAEALLHLNTEKEQISFQEFEIEKVSPFSMDQITKMVGYETLDIDVVSLAIFMTFPKKFMEVYPRHADRYMKILNYEYPVS